MLLRQLCKGVERCSVSLQHVRYRNTSTTKHWNPKYKKERAAKMIKVELPDFQKLKREQNLAPEELRSKLKREGIAPPRPWNEKPVHISATGDIFEAYVPPEGDGKLSLVSISGAKQRFERIEKKGKSMLAVRKIRQFEEEFNLKIFASQAQDIYVDAHKALTENNEDRLHELVTERCYPEMVNGLKSKTLRWTFIESIESPMVVHVRQTHIITDDNIYAQITVRMHTKQTMALYDRFGRLMMGSEVVAKDVLEYVVFEKHLSNLYGQWRMHGKIMPDWAVREDSLPRTFIRVTN